MFLNEQMAASAVVSCIPQVLPVVISMAATGEASMVAAGEASNFRRT